MDTAENVKDPTPFFCGTYILEMLNLQDNKTADREQLQCWADAGVTEGWMWGEGQGGRGRLARFIVKRVAPDVRLRYLKPATGGLPA